MLDQTALMKLLALCQDGLHQRDAHRSTKVACDIDER